MHDKFLKRTNIKQVSSVYVKAKLKNDLIKILNDCMTLNKAQFIFISSTNFLKVLFNLE